MPAESDILKSATAAKASGTGDSSRHAAGSPAPAGGSATAAKGKGQGKSRASSVTAKKPAVRPSSVGPKAAAAAKATPAAAAGGKPFAAAAKAEFKPPPRGPPPPVCQAPPELTGKVRTQFEALAEGVNNMNKARYQAFEEAKLELARLDSQTKVGHLLVELRSLGYVEICGKNIGNIYKRLGEWLTKNFGMQPATHALRESVIVNSGYFNNSCSVKFTMQEAQEWERVCDLNFCCGPQLSNGMVQSNGLFKTAGTYGENNMGKLTMFLVDFMTNECGWGLQLCDGQNLGIQGQIREQSIKFTAPHPLNLIAPHIMIELRQAGYIEINGKDSDGIYQKLDTWLIQNWGASRVKHSPDFCDAKYQTRAFKSRGQSGENNMGQRTMEIVDFLVQKCAWTLLTCNAGNYGRWGTYREQQMVFRNDAHITRGHKHVLVELRDVGYVEINGLHDAGKLGDDIHNYLTNFWKCSQYKPNMWEKEKYCDMKYTAPGGLYYKEGLTNNMGKRTVEFAYFMKSKGWALMLCNGGGIASTTNGVYTILREQQIKFTKAMHGEDKGDLLMVELRTQPLNSNGNYQGLIEINGPDTNGVVDKLVRYLQTTLKAKVEGPKVYCDLLLTTDWFRLRDSSSDNYDIMHNGRLNGESNFGRYSIRLCDFMVDHLGEWDLIVCNGTTNDALFRVNNDHKQSVNAREMQLIFRHNPGKKAIFMAAPVELAPLGHPPRNPPPYWMQATKSGKSAHEVVQATEEEKAWMQELLDKTYKEKVTRDREGKGLPKRFQVVSAIRSEMPALWDKYSNRRDEVLATLKKVGESASEKFVEPKTVTACKMLAKRHVHERLGNPTNEAYLLHGTNPTSATAILATSFKVDLAGKSAGTMFGPGVYLAEASTKADEYARDDNSGAYAGLFAMLVCRTINGRAFVALKPGNYAGQCTSGEHEVVVGDREKAVGTYREFIFFEEASIYPEYVAFYRRVY
eukprot:TRINITY_DN36249_c0_g1_i1.p1 TRINITY_DN36249_c0_g1~~TRINITY_DN36249_c0_g1_i1.p1  ORF type:complete len:969 (-),score=214.02 TRINITY_DN36249_c0_g1_i1:166-3072(-)